MSFFLFVLIIKTIDIIIKTLDNVDIQNPRSISSVVIKSPIIKIALAIITIKGKYFFINLFLLWVNSVSVIFRNLLNSAINLGFVFQFSFRFRKRAKSQSSVLIHSFYIFYVLFSFFLKSHKIFVARFSGLLLFRSLFSFLSFTTLNSRLLFVKVMFFQFLNDL